MANDFLTGLLKGLTPPIQKVIETRVAQELKGKGKGGFDNPEDIPKELGGQPLKSLKQDPLSGKWFGEYGPPTSLFGLPMLSKSTENDQDNKLAGAGFGGSTTGKFITGGSRNFNTEAEAISAAEKGLIKKGDKITIGGIEKRRIK